MQSHNIEIIVQQFVLQMLLQNDIEAVVSWNCELSLEVVGSRCLLFTSSDILLFVEP